MNEKIKYLIFFILGIILYTFFKRGLVEGLTLEDLRGSTDWEDDGIYIVNNNMACDTPATPSDNQWDLTGESNAYSHNGGGGVSSSPDASPTLENITYSVCKDKRLNNGDDNGDDNEESPAGFQYYYQRPDARIGGRQCKLLTNEELSSRFSNCSVSTSNCDTTETTCRSQKLALKKCIETENRSENGVCNNMSHYEFKSDPLPDITYDNIDEREFLNYKKSNFSCSIPRPLSDTNTGSAGILCSVDNGWTDQDVRAYGSLGVIKTNPEEDKNSCGYYDRLCFNVDNINGCRELCDGISDSVGSIEGSRLCDAFTFNEEDKCCLYKQGYDGYTRTDREGNCYKKITAEDFYNEIVDSGSICKTSREDTSSTQSGNYCACDQSLDGVDAPTDEDSYMNHICNSTSICNADSFDPTKNYGCHRYIEEETEETQEDTSCEYNEIIGSTGKRDSEILREECHCNVRISGNSNLFEEPCNSEGDNLKYCKIRDNTCSTLQDCESSDTVLDESCKYTNDNNETLMCNYLNENGVKDKIFNNLYQEKCKSLDDCSMDSQLEEHCFCPNPNMPGVTNICLPDHICSSGSGCMEQQGCQDDYTPNADMSKCIPPECRLYDPDTNSSPIGSKCVCKTDPSYNPVSGSGVCAPGNYCLPNLPDIPGNIPFHGCKTVNYLKPRCPLITSENTSPLTEECFCKTDGVEKICKNNEYCTNDGCLSITCKTDEILKLVDNKIVCINKNYQEPGLFDDFDAKDFFKKLKDKFKN